MVKNNKNKKPNRNSAKSMRHTSSKRVVAKVVKRAGTPVIRKTNAKSISKSKKTITKTPTARQNEVKQPIKQIMTATKLKEKEASTRKRTNVSIPQPDEAKSAIDQLLTNERAAEYLKKNVSKLAVDVIGMLVTPKTDEFLAEQLGMKINAIRRILNIMQGYGITNYYISKNTKGWLSFAWYINTKKLSPFLEYVEGMEKEKSIISEKCNDYFMCETCYKTDKFLFTFDSAFENSFKCNNCGKNLNRMDKGEVEVLINRTVAVAAPIAPQTKI